MLPTFVIGLREGIEAALIVGIIAAYLRQRGRQDALRWVWLGVALAASLCLLIGILLNYLERSLPQKEQEGLETVIGIVAVAFISYMILWMRRNARGIKHTLEEDASSALARNTVTAFIAMSFFAVLREGFETAVFVLAVFQSASDTTAAGAGVVLGLIVAAILGYLLYRGGARINLNKFFKFTGVVLVLVAAGLASSALHSAHEAGWFNGLQTQALNLTWLVDPGSVRSALLSGMLGLHARPTVGEVLIWLIYAVPLTAYVVWPTRKRQGSGSSGGAKRKSVATTAMAICLLLLAACGNSGANQAGSTAAASSQVVEVSLTSAGCQPSDLTIHYGPTTFKVTNQDAAAVTELEVLDGTKNLGEVENLTPGLSGSFSLNMKSGDFTLSCPNGKTAATGKLTVSANTAAATGAETNPKAEAAVSTYRTYLEQQTELLLTTTTAFVNAVKAGTIDQAKQLYAPARAPYERVEPVAESFGNLDPAIDAREGDVPANEWTGFHRIEKALWQDNSLDGMTPVADKLLTDVTTLHDKVQTVDIDPAQIANGSVELLNEVSASKITGEEERYSHIDLLDFQANVDGSKAAFDAVKPILSDQDADLANQISTRFADVNTALDPYRQGDDFVSYTTLTDDDTRQLSQSIDALAEPLSRVAEQVVLAGQ
ncbi:MAG TPA: iron uptake system protein EfeO [Nitrolancea sp.]|nr:iron uptake system protein EfeO [Nitrolancea sp.]